MQKSDSLIQTKLHLPFIRPSSVQRPQLQAILAEGLHCPLTLVVAPAGFGKTTLVVTSISRYEGRVAWLSLDKDDNQPERFLNYLIGALQKADDGIGSEAAEYLSGMHPAQPQTVLTKIINDLDNTGRDIVLVVDDYQFISNQAVHEQIAWLLEHCPNSLHLVICSRSDPPLPLARLRARSQTIELRAADLRFTGPEATQFLNDVMDLHLEAKSIAALEERTEGWIAGLQMAALSMRGRENVTGLIKEFSGTNRYILDYLLEEVLVGQSAEIQRFLLHTSILERLTAPLCDALVKVECGKIIDEAGDHSFKIQTSANILAYLEQANLFLVPLDDERIWYRYHHLFADLLRKQLNNALDAKGVEELHIRAADWHAQNGLTLEAINHASMASDDERVERFIDKHYRELVSRGEQSGLRIWTGKLNQELIYKRPWLCIYEAYSHAWFGELDQADVFLKAAEKRIQSCNSIPEAQAMLGHLHYIKSRVTAMRGDLPRAIQYNLSAREYLPVSNLALQLDLGITLGYLYFLNGDYSDASQFLNETIRSGRAVGAILNTVAGYCILARLTANEGRLNQCYELYHQAETWIQESGGQHLGASSLIEVGIADVLCERNDVEAALAHMKQGLSLLSWWGKPDDLALAYVTQVRLYLAQGNTSAATEAMQKAVHLTQTSGLFTEAPKVVELAQVKLWITQGDIQAATRWAASLHERFGLHDAIRIENEMTQIAYARVLIAQKKPDQAIELLSCLEENARSAQRMGRVIEILLLQALAFQELSDSMRAVQALTNCLALAEPEGYVRIFLDEGQSLQMLLGQWQAHTGASPLQAYAIHLVSQFDVETDVVNALQEKESPINILAEPLTPRELEVLHLIALGKTNQEIARHLIISPGTVKAHTASIFRKLDANNRTEAVAHARLLGILP